MSQTTHSGRRLAAICFADIVGYTRLTSHDEAGALTLIDILRGTARQEVESLGGRIVKFIGDGVLAEFASADAALRAALNLNASFEAGSAASGMAAQLRVGVHLGEITIGADGDIYGDGVNLAARLQSDAKPGQVLASEDVFRVARARTAFAFEALGERTLKGVEHAVPVFDVMLRDAGQGRTAEPFTRTATEHSWTAQAGMVAVGSVFADRYAISQEAGSGASAVVYRARDLKHDRDVALKVLRRELTQSFSADRFLREIGIAAKLTHPNILPLYDSGETNGCFYYVTPFIEGESLSERLADEQRLSLLDAVTIARSVAAALECAHSRGIVHRDIKPANILLASGQALVADFGIARALQTHGSERLTSTGLVVGTPAYMSPEQAVGGDEVDARSDIFSLGCVLYEMLTGEPPFRGPTVHAIVANRLTQDAADVREHRGEVPAELAELVAALLARAPAERVQDAATVRALLGTLEAACAELSGSTYARIAGRTFARARRRAALLRRVAIGVAGAAAVVLATWLARDTPQMRRLLPAGGMQTLAVLPLSNLSGDVEQEFFADGLTDALITDLSRLPGVNVISRTSVMQYKLMRKPIREIARELRADVVVEGTVIREGDRVRITAALVRGRDERSLWRASYEGQIDSLFALRRHVGVAVAREIGVRLTPAGAQVGVKPESEEQYLKGSYYAAQWRLEEALASFQRSVEIDPANAAAYAAMARVYYFRATFGEVAPLEAFGQMRRAAAAALVQDPDNGEAHGLMALVNTHFDYDWAGAEQHFVRALQLSPSNAQVHHDYAHFLLAMGRGPESVEASRRSVQLDPANAMLTSCLGWHSLFDDRFHESLGHAGEAQRMMPSFWALIVQGWAQTGLGVHEEAIESMRDAVVLAPELAFARAALAHALARNGETAEARALLAELLLEARKGYVSAYDIALIYAGLGENDSAFEWIAQAIAERSTFVVHLTWDARLMPLRSDRRFTDLVERLRIPAGLERPRPGRATAT
jgi:eukaryotic-like serine/threonine-protein kinase